MSKMVKITVTYTMEKGDRTDEDSINISAEIGTALLLRNGSIEDGYLKQRAKVYTLVNMLAALQGYDHADIVKIRFATKNGTAI